jgi:hypothetical protein
VFTASSHGGGGGALKGITFQTCRNILKNIFLTIPGTFVLPPRIRTKLTSRHVRLFASFAPVKGPNCVMLSGHPVTVILFKVTQ